MKDTKALIMKASLDVFSNKGYISATTLDISKQAGVSEMTLFRHFGTKNNLFIQTIKQAMGQSIIENLEIDMSLSFKEFVKRLLHEKLLVISTQIDLIKMLIRETLAHTLPDDLAFTKIISNQVIQKISRYAKVHKLDMHRESFAQLVVGLLLRYAIIEENIIYHKLDQKQQELYLENYINILNI
ncbi:MAG: TetR/AcrR family transcriptional regulator [Acholeplasmataceae bacterium]|nr:TetR/AcrR family transcriptional regulator [Acholeplasmataceae bacterium]